MHGDVMGVYARENQSRVVQEREEKQRQHEKEMERMRLDALMQRLSQASGRMPKASGPGFAIY
jgi:stringent starvation protein B